MAEVLAPRVRSQAIPVFFGPVHPVTDRFKTRLLMGSGKAIPRTNVLTNIAAKSPAVQHLFLFGAQVLFLFDAEVTDAGTAVDDSGLHDGLSRAGVYAGRASAAVVGSWSISG